MITDQTKTNFERSLSVHSFPVAMKLLTLINNQRRQKFLLESVEKFLGTIPNQFIEACYSFSTQAICTIRIFRCMSRFHLFCPSIPNATFVLFYYDATPKKLPSSKDNQPLNDVLYSY